MNELRQFIEFHYVVLCSLCKHKVMDPDKKKGQTHLKGKCPTCGGDSDKKQQRQQNMQVNHNSGKSKRQLKKERQAKEKTARAAAERAERKELRRAAKQR